MAKHVASLILMLVASLASIAQITHTADGDVDKQGQQLLNKAASKLTGGTFSFSVTMINYGIDKKETARQKADVLYDKGKYRVTQARNILYSDGKSVWHWAKQNAEVTVSPVSDGDDNLLNPIRLLATYKKNFKAKYIRGEDNGNAVIDLTPRTSKSYYKLRLVINAKTYAIVSLTLHNYDGSRGEYRIANFRKAKASAGDFTFNAAANPGVEVIDMR